MTLLSQAKPDTAKVLLPSTAILRSLSSAEVSQLARSARFCHHADDIVLLSAREHRTRAECVTGVHKQDSTSRDPHN